MFGSKIEILGRKAKLWVKNRNFGSKIEILCQKSTFGQKSTFWSKIDILVKNRHFGQKSTFWSKIDILVKNRNSTLEILEYYLISVPDEYNDYEY